MKLNRDNRTETGAIRVQRVPVAVRPHRDVTSFMGFRGYGLSHMGCRT